MDNIWPNTCLSACRVLPQVFRALCLGKFDSVFQILWGFLHGFILCSIKYKFCTFLTAHSRNINRWIRAKTFKTIWSYCSVTDHQEFGLFLCATVKILGIIILCSAVVTFEWWDSLFFELMLCCWSLLHAGVYCVLC